ncbi:short-chain dehydrogenase/reductase [Bombiscardovia apis]|uniref:Short-chain dehydrogenase/reductase n=1 Tax=Bombiscardovia apis TaxID=2932182 RepID=A0ABN6SEX8_9BIFI|nr:oxidoreductase [Bombiscardovia apis]BDR54567.1 short-chain dehydrogenase/reductase [Bombiscardovia apis]
MNARVVLITGATSGIGYQAAAILARHGLRVYGAGRHIDQLKPLTGLGVQPVPLDLSNDDSIQKAVEAVLSRESRIDILINNAGYGSYGPVEEVAISEVRQQFEVNLLGLARLTQLVLPTMRAQGHGRIINTSSMAGRMVTYMGAWYHATKYALEAFSDALRMETRQFNIDVVLIEPGAIATNWGRIAADHLEDSAHGGPYQEAAQQAAQGLRKLYNSRWLSKPDSIAQVIAKAASTRRPKTRYLVGFGAKPLVALHALLPDRAFDFIMIHAKDL